MNDSELVGAFESCALDPKQFSHERHLRVAWHYVTRYSIGAAMDKFREGLQRYTQAKGLGHIYNETITCSYVVLLAGVKEQVGHESTFEAVAERFPGLLRHRDGTFALLYAKNEHNDPIARRTFVLPGQFGLSPM